MCDTLEVELSYSMDKLMSARSSVKLNESHGYCETSQGHRFSSSFIPGLEEDFFVFDDAFPFFFSHAVIASKLTVSIKNKQNDLLCMDAPFRLVLFPRFTSLSLEETYPKQLYDALPSGDRFATAFLQPKYVAPAQA
ncbi:hypothetical protein MGYG_06154 [Nannizzia gypsea CBS 118893]|uniref:Uncharacterized protein n=1 Tax=Arthroderma gypseum (strain ATCC MYA-4604 / CBS 118893) TaxID=535722 RepID=E4V0M2_ARTGP|nr:hypothetical protein MGYG_06154 [Nannizzia gypsea CBS 118893]EFR03159.1 hypothetical protein MGYG_06154 [Nannizzia gypsea CBS 118893]